jgi:hypothetical protein
MNSKFLTNAMMITGAFLLFSPILFIVSVGLYAIYYEVTR